MSEPRILVILGSARGDGNTRRAVDRLCERLGPEVTIVDLSERAVAPFRYGDAERDDDFLGIIEQMLAHERIVFATPVYWYAMSGVMKTFFDRITDLLMDEGKRPLARSLAGRRVWLLASGTGDALPTGFQEPFAGTAAYLGMDWQDAFYVRAADEAETAPIDTLALSLRA